MSLLSCYVFLRVLNEQATGRKQSSVGLKLPIRDVGAVHDLSLQSRLCTEGQHMGHNLDPSTIHHLGLSYTLFKPLASTSLVQGR